MPFSFSRIVPTAVLAAMLTLQPLQSFAAEFNANHIISDSEMFDATSMTREAIQAFLESRRSGLSTYQDVDVVTQSLQRASDIIFNAAQLYTVNPRYLLVLLQKEQSLIERQIPTQKALDWAAGYAVCDSCSMDDPAIAKFKGFAKQIDNAAGSVRWWYEHQTHPSFKKVGQQYTFSNTPVTPQNFATGFLYTYTPHIQGNKNLWTIWNRWFTRVYPNGSLVKTKNSKTVYVIQKGLRRPFASLTALTSRYNPSQIIEISDADLQSFEEGPAIKFANYSILRIENGMTYLLQDDTIRYIPSKEVFRQLGYNPGEVIDITTAELDDYYQGNIITTASIYPLGTVVIEKKSGAYYYVENGMRQPIAHADVAKALFPNSKPITVDMKTLAQYPLVNKAYTFRDGMLVSVKGSPFTYVISDGMRRLIPNDAVFNGLGYKKENILYVSEQALLGAPLGDAVELNATTIGSK